MAEFNFRLGSYFTLVLAQPCKQSCWLCRGCDALKQVVEMDSAVWQAGEGAGSPQSCCCCPIITGSMSLFQIETARYTLYCTELNVHEDILIRGSILLTFLYFTLSIYDFNSLVHIFVLASLIPLFLPITLDNQELAVTVFNKGQKTLRKVINHSPGKLYIY